MTGLLPRKKIEYSAIDLRETFENKATQGTVARVIRYLAPVYEKYTGRTFAEISRENTRTEEFFLQMPTGEAFADELRLCEAITAHAAGKITDAQIKAVLDRFIESHTFVYFNDSREPKRGDFETWATCDLVYLSETASGFGFVCNYVQAYLVKLLHADLNFRITKL